MQSMLKINLKGSYTHEILIQYFLSSIHNDMHTQMFIRKLPRKLIEIERSSQFFDGFKADKMKILYSVGVLRKCR